MIIAYCHRENERIFSMDRTEAKDAIRKLIRCSNYLTPSKGGLYVCPFCGSGTGANGTGALKVYDTNTFTCHKCGKSGDVLDLIQETQNCDFNTAIQIGADILGIPLEATESPYTVRNGKMNNSFNGNTEALKNENTKPQPKIDITSEEYKARRDASIQWYANKDKSNPLTVNAVYDYSYGQYQDGLTKVKFTDQNGKKTFAWLYPDTASKYGFKWGRREDQKRLFVVGNLEETSDIFLTEGEKDAFTASELLEKITAVSSPDGAVLSGSGKWKDTYTEQLADKNVFILFDNDEAGQNFAGTEAVKVSEKAKAVFLLDITKVWADCPKGGDITDMVNALGKEKAKELIEDLIVYTQPFDPNEKEETDDYLTDFLTRIQSKAFEPYKTELPFFDSLLGGGVMPQSLILLMASPATGKTTLCQQIAETMAKHQKPIVYLNLEMSREQMLAKTIASRIQQKHPESRITANTVLRGYEWDNTQRHQITEEINEYRAEIYPYLKYNPDNVGHKLSSIATLLKNLGEASRATGKQAPAIVLDYLHLVSPDRNIETAEHIKDVVMTLKNYAMDYNTFVIGIVAINRQSNGRPSLDSGRDSSNIEYTADVVLSLEYKDIDNGIVSKGKDSYNEDLAKIQQASPREMIMRVLKSRFGEVGRSQLLDFYADAGYFKASKAPDPRATAEGFRNIPIV